VISLSKNICSISLITLLVLTFCFGELSHPSTLSYLQQRLWQKVCIHVIPLIIYSSLDTISGSSCFSQYLVQSKQSARLDCMKIFRCLVNDALVCLMADEVRTPGIRLHKSGRNFWNAPIPSLHMEYHVCVTICKQIENMMCSMVFSNSLFWVLPHSS